MNHQSSEIAFNMARELLNKYTEQEKNNSKPRILVAGKTGVGKSTLLNAMFSKSLAQVGVGKPVTQEITEYQSDDFPLIIADSKGLENQDYEEIVAEIAQYIKEHNNTGNEQDAVNLAWFCVSAPGGRFEDGEASFVETVHKAGIPVIIVMTQGKRFQNDGFRDNTPEATLRDYIKSQVGSSVDDIVLLRAQKEDDEDDDGNPIIKNPRGLNTLIEATNSLLPKGQKNAFAQALNVRNAAALTLKEGNAREIVNWATAAAAAAAAPIPGSDFLALAPIQGTMLYKIGNVYGVNTEGTNWKNVLTTVAAPLVSGMLTQAAGSLLKFIPVAGSILGGLISGASAGAMTKLIGEIYLSVLNEMTKQILSEGKDRVITADEAFENLAVAIKRKKDTEKESVT